MSRTEKLQKAKSYLEMLSNYIDPITGEAVNAATLKNDNIKDIFDFVVEILQEVIDNDGEVIRLEELSPLKIENLNKSAIVISDKPVQLKGLIMRINKEIKNSKMKKLQGATITNWLVEKGYLTSEKVAVVRNVTQFATTDVSAQIGIISEEKVDTKTGELKKNVLLTNIAQQFIIDNLDDILFQKADGVDDFEEETEMNIALSNASFTPSIKSNEIPDELNAIKHIERTEKAKNNLREGKISINNQIYYLKNGKISDDTYKVLPEGRALPILYKYYSQIDFRYLESTDLIDYIKATKESKIYNICIEAIEYSLENQDGVFIRKVLPIYTSCLRELKMPDRVVEFWENNGKKYAKFASALLYTSLASAYCDLNDYASASKAINRAYAMSGGGSGHKTEISLVYKRIKKEMERF